MQSREFNREESELPDHLETQKIFHQEMTQPRSIPAGDVSLTEGIEEEMANSLRGQGLPESLLEFVSLKAGLSSLNYTCVLVPRFPQHYLAGDVAKRISEWMPQLCISFGWRLERLSVRPQYLQWSIIVDPTYAPSKLIKLIRKETSKRLFRLRPDYELENPSRDFWAPGYLILSGYFSPSREVLSDFVQQTRIHQGIER